MARTGDKPTANKTDAQVLPNPLNEKVPSGEINYMISKTISPGVAKAFSESITADDENVYADQTMNGDWNFVKDAGVVDNEGLFNGVSFKFTYQSGTINFTSDFDVISDALVVGEKYLMVIVWYGLSFSAAYKKFRAVVYPDVSNMIVENADKNTVIVNFSESVDITNVTGWTFRKDATEEALTGVTGTGTTQLSFSFSSAATLGEVLDMSYDSGTGNVVSSSTSNDLQSFTQQSVTNNASQIYPAWINTNSMIVNVAEGAYSLDTIFDFTDGADNDAPFSIEIWYQSVAAGSGRVLAYTDDDTYASINFGCTSTGALSFQLFSSAGNFIRIAPSFVYLDNTDWHHLVATYDGSKAYTGMWIYHDSVKTLQSQNDGGTYTGLRAADTNFKLHIPQATGFGKFNVFRVYGKELSQADVNLRYNSGVPIAEPEPTNNSLILENRFNGDTDSSYGATTLQEGTPTFDTDIPT